MGSGLGNGTSAAWRACLQSEDDTKALGGALACAFQTILSGNGFVVWLRGNLGAGKTSLVRSALRALGIAETVRSPSYTLLEPYASSSLNFYHFDFYRFDRPDQFLERGFDEYFCAGAVCLVEWPEKATPYLPEADIVIDLDFVGSGTSSELLIESSRRIASLRALTPLGEECLSVVKTQCSKLADAA